MPHLERLDTVAIVAVAEKLVSVESNPMPHLSKRHYWFWFIAWDVMYFSILLRFQHLCHVCNVISSIQDLALKSRPREAATVGLIHMEEGAWVLVLEPVLVPCRENFFRLCVVVLVDTGMGVSLCEKNPGPFGKCLKALLDSRVGGNVSITHNG